jgi:hypothetical protein
MKAPACYAVRSLRQDGTTAREIARCREPREAQEIATLLREVGDATAHVELVAAVDPLLEVVTEPPAK